MSWFVHCKLQDEWFQDERGEYVENHDDTDQMEGDEIDPGPAWRHQDVSLGDHVPLIDDHELEEDDEGTDEVVKVVGAVVVMEKLGVLELDIAAKISWIFGDFSMKQIHSQNGKQIEYDEQDAAIRGHTTNK